MVEEAKPKAKATPNKLARSVKVVELVECNDCGKKMLSKSLRNTHPHYCKGQPTETLPVDKQKASYGSKVKGKLRKEIKEEMKAKYAVKEKQQEQVTQQPTKPVRMEETPQRVPLVRALGSETVPTARELLEASYVEIRKAKQQEKMDKMARFKTSMF